MDDFMVKVDPVGNTAIYAREIRPMEMEKKIGEFEIKALAIEPSRVLFDNPPIVPLYAEIKKDLIEW